MNNEEVKEEVEKVPEEVEEVSKKVAEEVPEEVQEVGEEVEKKNTEKFTEIKKLKCDYTVYKRERTKLKMPIIEKCEKCGTYCLTSLLEESGLCPDCEEEAEEEV